MRQIGSCFIGKRGTFQNASEMRQFCVKNGGEHLLDDTDSGCHRFLRSLDGPTCANRCADSRSRLILANRFQGSRTEPLFLRIALWETQNSESQGLRRFVRIARYEKIGFFFVISRSDSGESPHHVANCRVANRRVIVFFGPR